MVLQNIAIFLVSTLFSLYIAAVLIRFFLALSRADFYNPISQFLVNITNPVLVPMRRFIPAMGKIDTASLVLALGLKIISIIALAALSRINVGFVDTVLIAMVELLRTSIWIYILALIINAIMSWMGNIHGNPVASLLSSLTAPLLNPIRRVIPMIGMIDLSPLVAILGLNILLIILAPLPGI